MGTARNDKAKTAMARSKVYALLAGVFRAEPTVALVRGMAAPEFRGVLQELGVPLGNEFSDVPADKLVADLAVEYTRLFIGPGPHLSPHESVHWSADNPSEGALWGPQTVKVRRFIQATGLSYDEHFAGMPDHIGAELELMQRLTEKESEAWTQGAEEDARWCKTVQKRFFDEHLCMWVPNFCDKVIDMAQMDFFRDMASLTKTFLDFERTQLGTGQVEDPAPRRRA